MYDLNAPFKFGKYKGKSAVELAQTKDGRGYLYWLISQPTGGKYKETNEERNEAIKEHLDETQEKEEVPELKKLELRISSLETRVSRLEN